MNDPTQTEIDPRITERLDAIEGHVKELDIEASQVRVIAQSAQVDAARLYAAFGRPVKVSAWIQDVAVVGGMFGIAVGCWLVDPAIAWIVMGSILLGIPMIGSALRKRGSDASNR